MATPTGAAAARAGIDWILNPNIDFTETDTRAAENAVGGGFSGSQFAGINGLRLRDSERMNRIQLGNQLLNPFLEREQQTANFNAQIAADAARQAVSEAGLDRRLGSETASRLQLAILQGNQEAQESLLREAGLDRRQSEALRSEMERTRVGAQNDLLRTLIGANAGSGASGGAGGSRRPGTGVNDNSSTTPASFIPGAGAGFSIYPDRTAAASRPPTSSGGGSGNTYTRYIDQILRSYGLH